MAKIRDFVFFAAFLASAVAAAAPSSSAEAIVRLLNSGAAGSPKAYAEAARAVAAEAKAGRPLQRYVMAIVNDDPLMPPDARLSDAERSKYLSECRPRIRETAEKSGNPLVLYLLAYDEGDTNLLKRAADGGCVQARNAWGLMLVASVRSDSPAARAALEEAYRAFEYTAGMGDANGLYNLGTCLANGMGTPVDDARAAACFRAAAEKGHPKAFNSLGWFCLEGRAMPRDRASAALWFQKSAALEEPAGMFNYALALEKGDGVERNEKLAAEFFEKSAERGNVQAMNAYGVCRYRARGVAKDFGTARKWFVKAAEKGYAPAMDNLAVLYEKGEGVEKSQEEAMLWKMRSRATRGDQAALEWLSSRERASPERSAAEEFLVYESSDFGPADKCGIACLAVDPVSGGIREVSRKTGVNGAIYLALSADGRRLYSTMEISREGKKRGALAVFGTEGGKLVELDRLELDCACPCHISLAPSGDAIVFADYGGGIAGVAAIAPNGLFDHSVKPVLVKHDGAGGKGRQDRPHAHCARVTPDGKYLCVADLGLDKVVFYDFPSWRDGLREVPEMTIRVAAALGPRHLEFSPDGRFIFVVHELGNAVSAYRYNGKTAPEETSTLSTLPEGFTGPSQVAAVHATRDGSILAVSNRGHDSIAFFKVDGEDGKLKLGNIVPLKGSFPRDFAFTPAEDAIVVGHKKDNEVLVYRFDRDRCALKALGKPFPAFRPLCFVPSPR